MIPNHSHSSNDRTHPNKKLKNLKVGENAGWCARMQKVWTQGIIKVMLAHCVTQKATKCVTVMR